MHIFVAQTIDIVCGVSEMNMYPNSLSMLRASTFQIHIIKIDLHGDF